MSKTNPVVHFEMPYEDRERMVKFYREVFGWEIQTLGPEMDNYTLVQHPSEDADAMGVRGAIGGGFFPKSAENAHPSIVIGVEDIKVAMEKVKSAGGAIIESSLEKGEPMNIPGVGLYTSFTDTEGNRVSLMQSIKMA